MDAFFRYHQIKMAPKDIPKTVFITHRAVYAFKAMSFSLVNVRATYQRMMNTVFKQQIRRNMEVYADDMIMKSLLPTSHVDDLRECFQNLRKHKHLTEIPRVLSQWERNWGEPENNSGHAQHTIPEET